MIKGIFFDFDGVITVEKTGSPTIIEFIAKETGALYEDVKTAYYKYNRELLKGEITHEDMWLPFCQELNMKIDYSVLVNSFLNITIDSGMIEYIRELKKDYIVGLITDNKTDRIHHILSKMNMDSLFDVVAISASEHAQKTESKIFESVLGKCNLAPKECVFIDNTAKNLVVPSKMGINTILFDDEKRDISELKIEISKIINVAV